MWKQKHFLRVSFNCFYICPTKCLKNFGWILPASKLVTEFKFKKKNIYYVHSSLKSALTKKGENNKL